MLEHALCSCVQCAALWIIVGSNGFQVASDVYQTGSPREPYNREAVLEGHSQATKGDVIDGPGLQTTCTFTCPRFPDSLASDRLVT